MNPEKDQPIETGAPRGSGQWVLYVDDEASLAELGKRRLQGIGYRVECYTDPKAALAALEAAPDQFDVVVTDYWMPHMTGIAFARAVKGIRPDLPIMLLTGDMDELEEKTVLRAGVRLVARKPLTLLELGNALGATLGP